MGILSHLLCCTRHPSKLGQCLRELLKPSLAARCRPFQDSCCEYPSQLTQQLAHLIAKNSVRPSYSASLHEGCVVEVVHLNAEIGGDVITDEFQPLALHVGEAT